MSRYREHSPLVIRQPLRPVSLVQLVRYRTPYDSRCIADAIKYLTADESVSPERREYIIQRAFCSDMCPTTTARRLVFIYRKKKLEQGGIGNEFYMTLKRGVDFLRTGGRGPLTQADKANPGAPPTAKTMGKETAND